MKKNRFLLFVFCLLQQFLYAQQPVVQKLIIPVKKNRLSAGPSFPLGLFASTHSPGITISYIRIMGRPANEPATRRRETGFAFSSSLYHFFGRSERAGSSDFRYPGYSVLDLQGGLTWAPLSRGFFCLSLGPGLDCYGGHYRFIIAGGLQGSYPLSPKISIRPGLSFIKEPGTDALWIATIKAGMAF
ncbi:MAG: hypothetical protein HZA79_05190 [Sphingobacteriales bacterium]|nr:hypothetical protein [Sphingobacteriales bacterium]